MGNLILLWQFFNDHQNKFLCYHWLSKHSIVLSVTIKTKYRVNEWNFVQFYFIVKGGGWRSQRIIRSTCLLSMTLYNQWRRALLRAISWLSLQSILCLTLTDFALLLATRKKVYWYLVWISQGTCGTWLGSCKIEGSNYYVNI